MKNNNYAQLIKRVEVGINKEAGRDTIYAEVHEPYEIVIFNITKESHSEKSEQSIDMHLDFEVFGDFVVELNKLWKEILSKTEHLQKLGYEE